ncbi:MAG: methyltransferase domain-containing protein [Anaerolineae bacterium]|nr:methyltransferase domain-containing protein [Anaerolineae bacterium]
MTEERQTYFEARAPTWDTPLTAERDAMLRRLLDIYAADLHSAAALLEIGTGTGILIPYLREYAPSARRVSVDLAHAMLVRARERCPEALLAQANVDWLPFAAVDTGFDVVVCHNSFPHFPHKARALAEIQRVLRPGGLLAIIHDEPRAAISAVHAHAGAAVAHDLLLPSDQMQALLAQARFVDVRVEDAADHYAASGRRASSSKS